MAAPFVDVALDSDSDSDPDSASADIVPQRRPVPVYRLGRAPVLPVHVPAFLAKSTAAPGTCAVSLQADCYSVAQLRNTARFITACWEGDLSSIETLLRLRGPHAPALHAGDEQAFCLACAQGHAAIVQRLLELKGDRSVDVHAQSEFGLRSAARNGHLDVAQLLLAQRGARAAWLSSQTPTPMALAQAHGHTAIVSALSRAHERPGSRLVVNGRALPPLNRAACLGHTSQVHSILRAAARTGPAALAAVVRWGQDAAFRAACRYGHVNVLRALLSQRGPARVDVHALGNAALLDACQYGHAEVACVLLSLTGDREIHAGSGVFSHACRYGSVRVVRALLEARSPAQLDLHAHDEQALRRACRFGCTRVVQFLLSLTGARAVDVHARVEGALIAACTNGHVDVVLCLLALPGSRAPNVRAQSDAAFKGACVHKHVRVVQALLNATGPCALDVTRNNFALLATPEVSMHPHVCTMVAQHAAVQTGRSVDDVFVRVVDTATLRALHMACAVGHTDAARALFPKVDRMWKRGPSEAKRAQQNAQTALQAACANGDAPMVRLLLGAPSAWAPLIDAHYCAALSAAGRGGHVALLKDLLYTLLESFGLPTGWSPPAAADGDCGERPAQDSDEQDSTNSDDDAESARLCAMISFVFTKYVFVETCRGGHVAAVDALLVLPPPCAIDVAADDHAGLRAACEAGAAGVVRRLLGLRGPRAPDVAALDFAAVKAACHHRHTAVAAELLHTHSAAVFPEDLRGPLCALRKLHNRKVNRRTNRANRARQRHEIIHDDSSNASSQ